MTDTFDEAVQKLRAGPVVGGMSLPQYNDEDAAAYLREKFIPRARVESLIDVLDDFTDLYQKFEQEIAELRDAVESCRK